MKNKTFDRLFLKISKRLCDNFWKLGSNFLATYFSEQLSFIIEHNQDSPSLDPALCLDRGLGSALFLVFSLEHVMKKYHDLISFHNDFITVIRLISLGSFHFKLILTTFF